MGKAVLVIDMPSNCAECSLCKKMEDNCYYCMATNQIIVDAGLKTHWCPLLEMPEKSHAGKSDYYQWGDWEDGWNACIDELLP